MGLIVLMFTGTVVGLLACRRRRINTPTGLAAAIAGIVGAVAGHFLVSAAGFTLPLLANWVVVTGAATLLITVPHRLEQFRSLAPASR